MTDDPETEEEASESDIAWKLRLEEEAGEHDCDLERNGD